MGCRESEGKLGQGSRRGGDQRTGRSPRRGASLGWKVGFLHDTYKSESGMQAPLGKMVTIGS